MPLIPIQKICKLGSQFYASPAIILLLTYSAYLIYLSLESQKKIELDNWFFCFLTMSVIPFIPTMLSEPKKHVKYNEINKIIMNIVKQGFFSKSSILHHLSISEFQVLARADWKKALFSFEYFLEMLLINRELQKTKNLICTDYKLLLKNSAANYKQELIDNISDLIGKINLGKKYGFMDEDDKEISEIISKELIIILEYIYEQ